MRLYLQQSFILNFTADILSRPFQMPLSDITHIAPAQIYQALFDQENELDYETAQNLLKQQNLEKYMDFVTSEEKQAFLNMVNKNISYLQIDNLILNPKLKTSTQWKTVSKQKYQLIKRKVPSFFSFPIFSLGEAQNSSKGEIKVSQKAQFKLIKLLFCSSTQNHLFYGYVEKRTNANLLIRQLLQFFQYIQTDNTKVTFVETNSFRNYKLNDSDLDLNVKNQLIMVHGLLRFDQNLDNIREIDSKSKELFMIPLQNRRTTRIERNGQQMTMADEDSRTLSEHTMSTGAETPFTFDFEQQCFDLYRPYHKNALFGEKLEQEIENMKEYAREAIYTNIIQVPEKSQTIVMGELQKIAQVIEQNIEKKKMYQKQMAKDSKEYLKQTHHTIHFNIKDREVFSKEFISTKGAQLESKIRQNTKHIIYFSSSQDNN